MEMRGIDPRTFANVSNALPFELHPLDWLVTTIVYKYATYVKVKKISSSFKKKEDFFLLPRTKYCSYILSIIYIKSFGDITIKPLGTIWLDHVDT